MQYAAKAAPHKSVSRDQSRPALTLVHLIVPQKPRSKKVAWEGSMIATDSYQAVKVPVTFDELDEPKEGVYGIEPAVFKESKGAPLRIAKRDDGQLALRNLEGVEWPMTPATGVFDFDKLVPERETTWEIGFNIDVLKAAVDGLGTKQVALRFTEAVNGGPSELRPIIVRPINEDGDDGRIALVMPMRIKR